MSDLLQFKQMLEKANIIDYKVNPFLNLWIPKEGKYHKAYGVTVKGVMFYFDTESGDLLSIEG